MLINYSINNFKYCIFKKSYIIEKNYAPVAQLDRVPDYESGGRGFESSPVRHKKQYLF